MRRIFVTASIAGIAILGAAGIAATAAAGQQSYDVSDFDGISAVGPNKIVITVGSSPSVRADGPQETLDLMKVAVEDGELKIQPKREHWGWDDWDEWQDIEPATYYVTVPSLSSAATVGSGDMSIDRVAGKHFHGSTAGSARLDIASLTVDQVNFSVAGSGDVSARGSAGRSKLSIAGSGAVHARELTSETAEVSIAGSGDADLTVKDDAHVSMVGSGDVEITGGARCTVSTMGSGKARCNGALVEDRNGRNSDRWGQWDNRGPRWDWGPRDRRVERDEQDKRRDRDDD